MFRLNRQYIYPSLDGIKLFAVNFVLLITGILYQSNFVLIFNFALFSLVLCTMFYTHYHLKGIAIIGCEILPRSAKESATMIFLVKNKTNLEKNKINIYLKAKKQKKTIDQRFDLAAGEIKKIAIDSYQDKRGKKNFTAFISTTYPLGFFKTFIPVEQVTLITYPEKKLHHELLQRNPSSHLKKNASDDLIIDNYSPGDSPSRIIWKKSEKELYVRKGSTEISRDAYLLKIESEQDPTLEKKLELASYLLQNIKDEQSLIFNLGSEKYHFAVQTPKSDILQKIATYGLA